MTRTAFLVLAAVLFTLTAGSALAAGMKKIDTAVSTNLHSAEAFIGTEVRDNAGQKIGEIEDIAIDFNRGVGYAVVESDEALNIDKTFLVPLSALTSTHTGDYVSLTVSRDQLASMPHWSTGMSQREYDRNLHDFYGLSDPWEDLPGNVPIEQRSVPGSNLTYPGQREVVPSQDQAVPPGSTLDRR